MENCPRKLFDCKDPSALKNTAPSMGFPAQLINTIMRFKECSKLSISLKLLSLQLKRLAG